MVISPNTFEFNLFLTLTIIILIVKISLVGYLVKKVLDRKKETGTLRFDFLVSVAVLMFCLFVSRLLFAIYDFSLTQFDTSIAYLYPNYLVWKFAALSSSIGFIVILYTIDKEILNFKLKGILAILMLIFTLIQFFYPVNTPQDFDMLSFIGIFGNIVAIIIPIIFLYTGIKIQGLRKSSFIIAFGIIIYAIGSNLVIEPILSPLRALYGPDVQIVMYFLLFIFKITGLLMFSYGVTQFTLKR